MKPFLFWRNLLLLLTLLAGSSPLLAQAPAAVAEPPAAAPAAPAVDWAQKDQEFKKMMEQINLQTKARQISTAELQEKLKKGEKVVLLDTREAKEKEVSGLPGARLVLPTTVREMPLEDIPADATVVTYCTAGYRSGLAAVILEERLGRPVYTLYGGIIDWFNQGGQVVDTAGKPVNQIDSWGEPWSSYVHPR
jgi:rhodanese-related sulfurtransferase